MGKLLPAFATLLLGIVIGWFAKPSPEKRTEPAPEAMQSKRERPAPSRIATARGMPSFNGGAEERTREFREWTARMDASNWRGYFDFALSDEAADHGFLTIPSVESLEFLHKLGRIAGKEPITTLMERKMTHAAAEVMEGWASVAPEEAFAWITRAGYPTNSNEAGENNEVFAKAAGAMMDIDFDRVWKHFGQIREPLAREFIRRKGYAETDALLMRYWTEPAGGYDHDRRLQDLFGDWQARSYNYTEEGRAGTIDYGKRRETYGRYLQQDLNPEVRKWIEFQLERMPAKGR